MRWYGQLAVIAVLGAAGYGGWYAYKSGHLSAVPVLGAYLPAAGAGAPAQGQRPPQGPPPMVEVDTVRTGRVVETREAIGTVRAFESITVTAKTAGIVQKISFEEGQKVKAGDILVHLDAEERRADIEQAQAEIQRAAAQRDETSARLERAIALRRTGAGTEAQVTDLAAQVKTLESAIASAEARRRAAEARLEDLIIRAPFSGRLGTRSVSLGAYISPGTRITTLDDLSRVRLDFAVPENLLGQLQPGQAVRATSAAYGQRVFEGRVSVIDPRVDPVTRTVRLTADFPNPDEALKPGMFLSVALTVSARNDAVVIPEEAVVGEGLRHLVFTVKDNVVERRVVRIGQRQEGRVEIVEGLQPGETIVVRGVQRVRPGLIVTPKPLPESAPGPSAAAAPAPSGPSGAGPETPAPALPAAANAPSPAASAPAPQAAPPAARSRTGQPAARGGAASDRRS
jgi:membrane fusion protein, multidrug efflux system